VTVTQTELKFGYKAECAAMIIDRTQITSVESIDRIHGLCDWGGYGIRKQLPSWDTGYIPKNGSGIRVTFKDARGDEKDRDCRIETYCVGVDIHNLHCAHIA